MKTLINQLPETEIVLAQGAKEDYVFFISPDFEQDIDEKIKIVIGDQAETNIYYCYFGEYNVKVVLEYVLGQRTKVNHYLLFAANKEQSLSWQEKYIFAAPGSFGRFIVRGLVQEQAKAVCDGQIVINPGAQKTDAYLDMQGVIMDREAKVEMIPGLQIEANDVKASHAAKISMLDEEQLFYLKSRGIKSEQAKSLFASGMFGELVNDIPEVKIREQIMSIIKHKLYGGN